MKKYLRFLILLLALSFIAACLHYNSVSYISSTVWKYQAGTASRDLLQFEITNNNEFAQKGIDEAVVVFCSGKHLFVKNKLTNKFGYYLSKSGFDEVGN